MHTYSGIGQTYIISYYHIIINTRGRGYGRGLTGACRLSAFPPHLSAQDKCAAGGLIQGETYKDLLLLAVASIHIRKWACPGEQSHGTHRRRGLLCWVLRRNRTKRTLYGSRSSNRIPFWIHLVRSSRNSSHRVMVHGGLKECLFLSHLHTLSCISNFTRICLTVLL